MVDGVLDVVGAIVGTSVTSVRVRVCEEVCRDAVG